MTAVSSDVFSPAKRKRHSRSQILEDSSEAWPFVVGPQKPGRKVIEFPLSHEQVNQVAAVILAELTVLKGEVSVACMGPRNTVLAEAVRGEQHGRTSVSLTIGDLSQCRSLMFRNGGRKVRPIVQIHSLGLGFENLPHEAVSSDLQAPHNRTAPTPALKSANGGRGQKPIFEPGTRLRHNKAIVVKDDDTTWPLVITPEGEWTYALEFAVTSVSPVGRPALISVDLTVLKGAVGVCCLDYEGNVICEAFRSLADGLTTASLFLEDFSRCQALLLRTSDTPGRSVVQIHDVTVEPNIEAPVTPILEIDPEVFTRYQAWTGTVPPGFTGDWLGVVTRAGIEWSTTSPEMVEALSVPRPGTYPAPTTTELLLDWEPLLVAVELSGPKCTAVALGAGWGRWIVGCAFAAQQRGRDYHIVGVEAEPQHFEWMARHLKDNNIPPEKSRLIHAAANSYTGTCYFMVGNAQGWYGQAVVSDAQFKSADFQKVLRESGATAEATACVDLQEIFAGLDRVDYLHMDIQGSEADVLLAYPDLLDERVATVNIGTHSELIERRLRRHFTERGWLCRYDIPMNATILASADDNEPSEITFGDGVLVWENPRLTGRTEVASFKVPTLIRG